MTSRQRLLRGALLLTIGACGDKVCTAMGCLGGITVHLDQRPTVPFTVTVTELVATGTPLTRTVDCPDTIRCADGTNILFEGFSATSFRIQLKTAAGESSKDFVNVQYSTNHPNGPTCPGSCSSATIEMTTPK